MPMFATIVDVAGIIAYPSIPQVVIPFKAEKIAALNMDDRDRVAVSFDGQNDAGFMDPGGSMQWAPAADGITKVWVRTAAAGKPPTEVQIAAEV